MSNTSGQEVGNVYLKLTLENDVGQQVAQATQQTANQVGSSMGSMFKKAFSVAAIAAIASKLKSMMSEFEEYYKIQNEQETKLETVMRQRMGATEDQIQMIKDTASATQQIGVIGDEVLLAGSQQLATFMNNADNLKTLMPAIGNLLAQQKGLNATTADAVTLGNLFGKAMQGNVGALTKVGITFDEAQEKILKYGTEEERAATLAQVATDNVGKMNEALAGTREGKMAQLSNRLSDIKEQFGDLSLDFKTYIIPYAEKFLSLLETAAENMKPMLKDLNSFLVQLGVLDPSAIVDEEAQSRAKDIEALRSKREDIVNQIEEIKEKMDEANEDEKEKEEKKKKDDGPKAASFDKFNILSFKSATEDLKDAADSLEKTTENMGEDMEPIDYNKKLLDLTTQLAQIDADLQKLQKEDDEAKEKDLSEESQEQMKQIIKDMNITEKGAALEEKNMGIFKNAQVTDEVKQAIKDFNDNGLMADIFNKYYNPETNTMNTDAMTAPEYAYFTRLNNVIPEDERLKAEMEETKQRRGYVDITEDALKGILSAPEEIQKIFEKYASEDKTKVSLDGMSFDEYKKLRYVAYTSESDYSQNTLSDYNGILGLFGKFGDWFGNTFLFNDSTSQPELVVAEQQKTTEAANTTNDKLAEIERQTASIAANSGGTTEVHVYLGDKELTNEFVKKVNTQTRQKGKSQLLR